MRGRRTAVIDSAATTPSSIAPRQQPLASDPAGAIVCRPASPRGHAGPPFHPSTTPSRTASPWSPCLERGVRPHHVRRQLGPDREVRDLAHRSRRGGRARDGRSSRHRRGRGHDDGGARCSGRRRRQAPDRSGRRRCDQRCGWPGVFIELRPQRRRPGDGDDPEGGRSLRQDRHRAQQRAERADGPGRRPRPRRLGGDVRHQRAGALPHHQEPAPGDARTPARRHREHDRLRGFADGRGLLGDEDGPPLTRVHRRQGDRQRLWRFGLLVRPWHRRHAAHARGPDAEGAQR